MPTIFNEFSTVYNEFKEKFPNHQLTEEMSNRIGRRDFPKKEWMREKIIKMRRIMKPIWLRTGNTDDDSHDGSS